MLCVVAMGSPKHEGLSCRLRAARERGAISAYKLDQLANLTIGHVYAIERGARANMEVKTAEKLARTLGVSLDWLIAGTGDAPSESSVRSAVADAMARWEARRAA